ncbi:hypothetical protein K1T71_006665 [Dendrolimus kikuchii]|uniref:Uncharacterized protein n=1 Tax=Dendrolimus kikuchii TaxID=765133 RepID=A0ACC1D2M5_9NEOP|nr:hypothetical protein K1T71_006665 [Dendrolimus kikuchii]
MNHAGTQTLLADLRNNYWILGIRRLVKAIVSRCIICKRYKAKHYVVPEPPLPADRIKNTAPFEVTGIDLAGPLFLRSNQKCWIVLFTCAVYRAVHLELTESLSTNSFLMTLRRFIARRGRPRTIYTDNGTNFVGAANLLKELDWQTIEETTNIDRIQWKFSVPTAPWWGGWCLLERAAPGVNASAPTESGSPQTPVSLKQPSAAIQLGFKHYLR